MTKKLILLILALPLLLMVCLFATTETVSLTISVPVSGIDVIGNEIIYLDLDQNEKYFVDYVIYPTNAENLDVNMTTEQVGDDRLAGLAFEDGYIVPKSVGKAKVYINTIDGGYSDSFIVQVDSNKLQAIECTVSNSQIYVGETATIDTSFIPTTASTKVITYRSSDSSVATVNNRGIITGVAKGYATITVCSKDNEDIYDTIDIQINNKDVMDLGQTEVISWNTNGSLNISIDTLEQYQIAYAVKDDLGNDKSDIVTFVLDETNKAEGKLKLDYTIQEGFIGVLVIEITIETEGGHVLTKSTTVNIIDELEASFLYDKTPNFVVGEVNSLIYVLNPYDANVSYEVESDNDNVLVQMNDEQLIIFAQKAGVSKVTLTILSNDVDGQSIAIDLDVAVAPKGFTINESANSYGIEGTYTIGQYNSDGTLTDHKLSLSYTSKADESDIGSGFKDNLTFISSNDKVSIDSEGKITINDSSINEIVEFRGVFSYGTYKLESQPIKIRCVGGAYDVDSYLELYKAVSENKEVVLQDSIKDDFGYDENNNVVYSTIKTTYDWDYHKNRGSSQPLVKVLLNIKNNIYGNGYEINANNITNKLDGNNQLTSDAIFRGPLNFVALTDSSTGGGAVSVKGQDNIVFAVYENVNLNNVILKSCDLDSGESSTYDLVDLDYTGTTVEVLGDNVNIEYSRISNGRTVLRVFGDINDSSKVINLNIKNSELSNGREFILRMGTNAFVNGSLSESSVNLPGSTHTKFPVHTTYDLMNDTDKKAYEDAFIKTFVNIKDSAFRNSGIFCVGMDSHFSGPMLADGVSMFDNATYQQMLRGWKDLAKTSYGAKLSFEGDVRIYDWKKLDDVDSSTLIDVMGFENNDTFGTMSLNVKELVRSLASSNDNYKTILVNHNDTDYVHGGIAFFGGGKNYSVFDDTNYNSYTLSGYTVSLSDTSVQYLAMAAGSQPFYFLLHDRTSNFSPQDQENLLSTGEAYDFILPHHNS